MLRRSTPVSPAQPSPTRRCARPKHYIEEEEGAANRLLGFAAAFVTAIAVGMSLFHLYTAIAGVPPLFTEFPIIATQPLRYTHVAFVLVLCFLLFPLATALPQPHPAGGT